MCNFSYNNPVPPPSLTRPYSDVVAVSDRRAEWTGHDKANITEWRAAAPPMFTGRITLHAGETPNGTTTLREKNMQLFYIQCHVFESNTTPQGSMSGSSDGGMNHASPCNRTACDESHTRTHNSHPLCFNINQRNVWRNSERETNNNLKYELNKNWCFGVTTHAETRYLYEFIPVFSKFSFHNLLMHPVGYTLTSSGLKVCWIDLQVPISAQQSHRPVLHCPALCVVLVTVTTWVGCW